ncbi:MAG: GNAT family N-acetyltransferase [Betaproteobacteria bacterium]|nr:GNAT family N-acetyltransferase [Betaproteobacteria bacterium]
MSADFAPVRKLEAGDPVETFDCSQSDLNRYLQRCAWSKQKANSAQSHVVCAGFRLAGYYNLSVAGVDYTDAPERIAKGQARHPVPLMLLARLAVDRSFQGKALGTALLKDALLRTLQAADIAGIRAVIVHAKDEAVRQWYLRFGVEPGPITPMQLFLLLKDIQNAVR